MPRIEFLGDDDTVSASDSASASASIPRKVAPLPKRRRIADHDESETPPDDRLSLEAIRRSDEGIFAEMKCLVCEKFLGADLDIDHQPLRDWNESYYTMCDYMSPSEMFECLAKEYNRTLADEGQELTALQVRNHFESNHLLDQNWSIRSSIRNLETVERRLTQHCFTRDTFDPKAIDSLLKVTTTKHALYNTRQKRLAR
jgi:hypothetical protein